jgi:hypothetical protein
MPLWRPTDTTEVETAVKELPQSVFDMKKLSIVGCDYQTDEHMIGYYTAGNWVGILGNLRSLLERNMGIAVGLLVLLDSRRWAVTRCGTCRRSGFDTRCVAVGQAWDGYFDAERARIGAPLSQASISSTASP